LICFPWWPHPETVRGRAMGCGIRAMDGAVAPRVRALCLRSIASQAPERQPPAAGPIAEGSSRRPREPIAHDPAR
jgi:hypothetical protein